MKKLYTQAHPDMAKETQALLIAKIRDAEVANCRADEAFNKGNIQDFKWRREQSSTLFVEAAESAKKLGLHEMALALLKVSEELKP